jgi:DME family drug/metabolite transporter
VLVGGVVLMAIAARGLRAAWPQLRATRGPLVVAVVATAAYQPAFFTGVREAGVTVGTIVTVGAAPFLAGLISVALGDHRPSRRWLVTTVIAAVGLVLLVRPDVGGTAPSVLGLAAALAAGAAFAAYTVAARRMLVQGVPRLAAVAVTFLAAGLLLVPVLIGALGDAAASAALVTPRGLAVVAWLGVGATAAAYLLFTAGLRTVPAVTGATMALAEPLTASALGVLVLGERLPAVGAAGAALVVVALVVAARRPERVGAASRVPHGDAVDGPARR